MKVKKLKGWDKLDYDFSTWYDKNHVEWEEQKKWLSKELIDRGFIEKSHKKEMWNLFSKLSSNFNDWQVQRNIMLFVILCLTKVDDIEKYIE